MIKSLLRLLAPALLLATAMLVGTAAPASAHAVLVASTPTDGARLAKAPRQVTLRFDEPVQVVTGQTRVITDTGDRVDTGTPQLSDQDRTVTIELRAGLGRTRAGYLVSWRVVSADSHLVNGSLRFGVGRPAPADTGRSTGGGPPTIIAGIGTGLGYAGLIGAVGCLATGLLVWPSALRSRRLRTVIIVGTAAILAGAAVELITEAVELGRPGSVLDSASGRLLIARMIIAAALAPIGLDLLMRRRTGTPGRPVSAALWSVVAAVLVIITAAHGHALAGPLPRLTVLATAGHLAGMCGWLGGLVLLAVVIFPRLRQHPGALDRSIADWSRYAFGCVAVLIISGELLAWRQIQPVDALWRTPYGVILLIKLALIAIALTLGRLTSRYAARSRAAGHPRSATRVRVQLAIEVAAAALIITAATVLGSTPPARDTYGPPVSSTVSFPPGTLTVAIASTHRGPQQVTVTPRDTAGDPVRLDTLTGRLSSTDAGVSAIDVDFRRSSDVWHSTDATAPLPGVWTLQLIARPGAGPAYVTSTDYRVW